MSSSFVFFCLRIQWVKPGKNMQNDWMESFCNIFLYEICKILHQQKAPGICLCQICSTYIVESIPLKSNDKIPIYQWKRATNPAGSVFCLLLGVSLDYAQPITGQVTEVTCPVTGRAQPELTPSRREKTGPGQNTGLIHNEKCSHFTNWLFVQQLIQVINIKALYYRWFLLTKGH